MKIRIAIIFYLLISISSYSQKVSSSQDISKSRDETIASVKDFWIAYINDISKSNDSNKTAVYSKYWNKTETEDGFTDIINDALPVYSTGELEIENIRKVQDGIFQISNQVVMDGKVFARFNVYVKEENSGYKLYNELFFSKSVLEHYKTVNIDFYYPGDYPFKKEKANELSNSYTIYSNLYGNIGKNRITCIIGNTFNEACSYIGIGSDILSGDSPYAGFSIKNQNIILSCREDHLHEVIHLIFFSLFPDSPYIFHEGVATYYGGTGGKDYTTLTGNLKTFVKNHPGIDLSDFDTIDKTLEDGTNYCYTTGAILIDYALKTGGTKKVLSLFRHSAGGQEWDDPLPAINDELGIAEDQIDPFIKIQVSRLK